MEDTIPLAHSSVWMEGITPLVHSSGQTVSIILQGRSLALTGNTIGPASS